MSHWGECWSDFWLTGKKRCSGQGWETGVFIFPGVITVDDLPAGWGLYVTGGSEDTCWELGLIQGQECDYLFSAWSAGIRA